MKTIALVSVLVGTVITLNAQEVMWEGTHRIVSSTSGIESFNPQESKTFCQITENDGQLTGLISMFGRDVLEKSQATEKLQGTIRNQISEGNSGASGEIKQKKIQQSYKTTFRGVKDGDKIVGYFEQTWDENGKVTVTYRGILELNKTQKD